MKCLIGLACSLLLTTAWAESSYYCPNTSAYIQVGDAMNTVETNCGKPSTVQEQLVKAQITIPAKQWIYNVNGSQSGVVVFLIQDNQVSGIQIAGMSVSSTNLCGNRVIRVGDPASLVTTACGMARIENQTDVTQDQGTKKITVWMYDNGPYQPQLKLEFDQGVLTNITLLPR